MINAHLINCLQNRLSQNIQNITPLTGGDINEVFRLKTTSDQYVVKINSAFKYPNMFQEEAKGLSVLRLTNTFTISEVIALGEEGDCAYLVLAYIDSVNRQSQFWDVFGQNLAKLHSHSQSTFGFDTDNYIGSLPQKNQRERTAASFYIQQRLVPQFEMAQQKGYVFQDLEAFYHAITQEIPDEPSSLIHGDLWGGNFMVDNSGLPCLIDPAVAYAPREMDIAMMHLFGGFDARVFEVYQEVFPMQNGWQDRISLFQLYYLLVHLNLFGQSYYRQVKSIVDQYM